MKAKDYLAQIMFIECKIQDNRSRVQRLKEAAENRTSKLTPDKVQTSSRKDKLGDTVGSWVDLEKMIAKDEKEKQDIIDTISLLNPYESAVLHQCYVNDKTLGEVARDMNRSYSWVAKEHRAGIKGIQAILDKREKSRG